MITNIKNGKRFNNLSKSRNATNSSLSEIDSYRPPLSSILSEIFYEDDLVEMKEYLCKFREDLKSFIN